MPLGEKIAELRRQRGWSQNEFAEKIGVHGRHISRLETNRMRPSSVTLKRIAEVFAVRLDELLDARPEVPAYVASDRSLLEKFEQLQELEPEDRAVVYRIIENFATQKRMARLLVGQKVPS